MSTNITAARKNPTKNRPNISISSNVHNNQKPLNRNPIRNANGQMATNNYHNNQVSQPLQNNVGRYPNSISPTSLEDIAANGVYKDRRLMHTVTSLIGSPVEVQLLTGEKYEGILKTFSPEFDLVLFSAAKIINTTEQSDKSSNNINNLVASLENKLTIDDTMVIKFQNMVKLKFLNVDMDYATSKKSVLTDSEIAKTDLKKTQNKELVPFSWADEGGQYEGGDLEENVSSSNGWNSNDMFSFNEKKYNINSTYTDDMPEYTIQLEHREDEEFLQRQAKAELIAREIEKDPNRLKRLAKEDEVDERDEAEKFSDVIAARDESNLPSNISSPRSEISHSSRDDRRGDPMRNNDGFRTQNSRRGPRGGPRSSVNDSNWRDTARDGRLNSSRFNPSQPTQSYNNNNYNPKPSNPPAGYNAVPKYPPANNLPLNQYNAPNAAGPKTSYSAVSQRHTSTDSLTSENEAKPLTSNRGHVNEDSYSRRSASGLNQRDSLNKQRNSTSRNSMEHDSPKPSNSQGAPDSPKGQSTNTSPTLSSGVHSLSSNESSFVSSGAGQQKPSPSQMKSELGNNQPMLNKNKSIDDSQSINAPNKAAEAKKPDHTLSQSPPTTTLSTSEAIKTEIEYKMDSPPPSLSPVPNQSTQNVSNAPADSSITSNSENESKSKSSSLNPNAKIFTPRAPAFVPQQNVVSNYSQYPPPQHLSTTPPSVPAMTSPYMPQQPQMMIQPHHQQQHHQVQQQQIHPQMPRNNYAAMQFPYGNAIIATPQMGGPQYIMAPHMGPNGMPQHAVYTTGPLPGGVPAPSAPPQNAVSAQAGAGGQLAPHHMVSSGVAGPQGIPNQSQPSQGPSRPYRGNKGGSNHNSGPNQVSQQYLRQPPHHDYNQQSQVANVTGQPILAGPQPHPQMHVAYSAAAPMHPQVQHHTHNQSQPNIGAPHMGQPTQIHYMYNPNFGRPTLGMIPQGHPQALNQLNIAASMPTQMYDPSQMQMIMAANCGEMVASQQIQPVPTQNPNMQSAPNIASAPSNQPNANQAA